MARALKRALVLTFVLVFIFTSVMPQFSFADDNTIKFGEVDIIVVVDLTTTMANEISAAKEKTIQFANDLADSQGDSNFHYDVRLGLYTFRDKFENWKWSREERWTPFCSKGNDESNPYPEFTSACDEISEQQAVGLANEGLIDTLNNAVGKFSEVTNPDATKMLILLTDEGIHFVAEPYDNANTNSLDESVTVTKISDTEFKYEESQKIFNLASTISLENSGYNYTVKKSAVGPDLSGLSTGTRSANAERAAISQALLDNRILTFIMGFPDDYTLIGGNNNPANTAKKQQLCKRKQESYEGVLSKLNNPEDATMLVPNNLFPIEVSGVTVSQQIEENYNAILSMFNLNDVPTADISVTPTSLQVNSGSINCTAQNITDDDLDSLSYDWSFAKQEDDGSYGTGTTISETTSATYTPTEAGTYKFIFTVTDYYGLYDQDEQVVNVTEPAVVPPVAPPADEENAIYDMVTRPNDGAIVMAGEGGYYKIMKADKNIDYDHSGQWGSPGKSIKALTVLNSAGDVLMAGEDGYYQVLKGDNTGLYDGHSWIPGVDINSLATCSDGKVILVGDNGKYQVGTVLDGTVSVTTEGEWIHGSLSINGVGLYSEQAETEVTDSPLAGVFNYAVFSDAALSISGNVDIDGDVAANGNITLGGNAYDINGSVYSYGNITYTNDRVDGEIGALPSALTMPTVSETEWKEMAKNPPDGQEITPEGGTYTIDGGTYNLGPCLINGNLTITGSANVTTSGIIWVTGDVNINGANVKGTGTIISQNKIDITGNANYSSDAMIAFVSLLESDTDIAISRSGNTHTKGVLFAPKGKIRVTGNFKKTKGAVVGKIVELSGTPVVEYDTNLADYEYIPYEYIPEDPDTGASTKYVVFVGQDGKYQVFEYDGDGSLSDKTSGTWETGGEARDINAIALTTAGDSPNVFMLAGESGYYGQLDDADSIVEDYNDQWSSGLTAVDKDVYAMLKLNDGNLAMVGAGGYFNVTYVQKDEKGSTRTWPFSVTAPDDNIYCIAQLRDSDGDILVAGSNGHYWWVDTPVIGEFTDKITAANQWTDASQNKYFPNSPVISKIVITPYRENVQSYEVTIDLNSDGGTGIGNGGVDIDMSSIEVGYRSAGVASALTQPTITKDNDYQKISFTITPPADSDHPDSAKRMVVYVAYKFKKDDPAATLANLNLLNKVSVTSFKDGDDKVGAPKVNTINIRDSKPIKYR